MNQESTALRRASAKASSRDMSAATIRKPSPSVRIVIPKDASARARVTNGIDPSIVSAASAFKGARHSLSGLVAKRRIASFESLMISRSVLAKSSLRISGPRFVEIQLGRALLCFDREQVRTLVLLGEVKADV
jgi:hypothetical protein